MSTGNEVAGRVAFRCFDSGYAELSQANYLSFVNDALADLQAAGWVLPLEEDESLTQAASTFSYTVPATFAYISEVRMETSAAYDVAVPKWQWRLGYDGSNPVLVFDSRWWTPAGTKKIKLVGQQRFTAYETTTTVHTGVEAFVRERAVAYACAHLGSGSSALAKLRQRLAEFYWQTSETLLTHQPDQHKVVPGSKSVPTR